MARMKFSLVILVGSLIPLVQQVACGQRGLGRIRERIQQSRSAQTREYPTEKIQVGIAVRTYLLHLPPSYEKGKPLPLLLVFHGGGTPAQRMIRYSGMSDLADREGFVVVYPQGTNNHWNDGRKGAPQVDDVAFIRTLIDHLGKTLSIDRRRIYATGISNGGMFTQRLACELSGTIAAIASVAASMPEDFSAQCKPAAPISVLMIHGTDDPLVPYRGGQLSGATAIGGRVWPVADTINYWVAHDRCSTKPATELLPDKDTQDGTRVRRDAYSQCIAGTDVVLYTVEGGGHTWPGSNQYLPERLIGRTSMDVNGSEVIWDFFAGHAMK